MARMPIYAPNVGVDTGAGTMRLDRADTSIAQGIGQLARGLGQLDEGMHNYEATLAAKVKRDTEQTQAIRAAAALREFTTGSEVDYINRRDAMPVDGSGFATTLVKDRTAEMQKLVDTLDLPEGPIKEKYRQQFQAVVDRQWVRASEDQASRFRGYVQQEVKAHGDEYAKRAISGEDRVSLKTEADTIISTMGMPSAQAEQYRKAMHNVIDAGRIERLRQTDPNFYKEVRNHIVGVPDGPANFGDPKQYSNMLATADKYNLDPRWMFMVAGRENSKMDPNLKNPKSSAFGKYQMIDSDWAAVGMQKTNDPALQDEAMARRLSMIQNRLNGMGVQMSAGAVYGSHLLGQAGYFAMLRNPDMDAYAVYSQFGVKLADQAFANNGKLLTRGMTARQALDAIEQYANTGMTATDALLAQRGKAPIQSNAPLTIGGEVFEGLDRRAITSSLLKSREEQNRLADDALKSVAKTRPEIEIINSFDPTHRKTQSDIFREADIGNRLLKGDNDAYQMTLQYAQTHKFVPAPATAAAERLIMTGADVGEKIKGYKILAMAHNADPVAGVNHSGVEGALKERVKDFVALENSALGANPTDQNGRRRELSAEDMTRIVSDLDKIHDPKRERKTAEFKEKAKDLVSQITFTKVSSNMGMRTGWFGFGKDTTPTNQAAQDAITAQYTSRFTHYYSYSGDETHAHARAAQDMRVAVGVTKMSGKEVSTAYPIEKVYPGVGVGAGSHAYIQEQVLGAVRANETSKKDATLVPAKIKIENVHIIGDARTGQEFAAGTPPTYTVWYKNSSGQMDALPERWRPDVQTAIDKHNTRQSASGDSFRRPPPQATGDTRKARDAKAAADAAAELTPIIAP